jgi:hypothetical protein
VLDQRQEILGTRVIGNGVQRVLEVIFVDEEVVCRPQIERELQGAHQLKTFRDVLHRSLIEEVGVAASAPGPVSGVSVYNHLRVGAARDASVADEIKA